MAGSGSSGGGGLSSGSSGAAYSGGGGGGGLSSGSSGAAYSSGRSSSASGSSRPSFIEGGETEEEKRLRELLKQQAAAQAAQAAAQAQAEASSSLTAQTPTQMTLTPQGALANPLTLQTPAQMTMPRVETPAVTLPAVPAPAAPALTRGEFQQTLQQTPYGEVRGVIERPAQPPNPLAREGVFQAAEAYRNLPANATPNQRAQVMGNYQAALVTKFGTPEKRAYDQQMGAREDRMVELAGRGLPPDQQAQAMADYRAKWRTFTPEQQGQEYYKASTGSEKGFTGGETQQAVKSLAQEAEVRRIAQRAAKESHDMAKAEREARTPFTNEKGRRQAPDYAEADRISKLRAKHDLETGGQDPRNPTVGFNINRAAQVAENKLFGERSSTLQGLAQAREAEAQQARVAAREGKGQEKASEKSQQELTQQAEQARREREAWLDQLRRRTATYYYA